MKPIKAIKTVANFGLATLASAAFAHEGHGLEGPHWHATDAWGFVALGAMIALAIWLTRGGK